MADAIDVRTEIEIITAEVSSTSKNWLAILSERWLWFRSIRKPKLATRHTTTAVAAGTKSGTRTEQMAQAIRNAQAAPTKASGNTIIPMTRGSKLRRKFTTTFSLGRGLLEGGVRVGVHLKDSLLYVTLWRQASIFV